MTNKINQVSDEKQIAYWEGDNNYASAYGFYEAYKCSKCGYGVHWRDIPNTCPNCRAKMKGGEKNESIDM